MQMKSAIPGARRHYNKYCFSSPLSSTGNMADHQKQENEYDNRAYDHKQLIQIKCESTGGAWPLSTHFLDVTFHGTLVLITVIYLLNFTLGFWIIMVVLAFSREILSLKVSLMVNFDVTTFKRRQGGGYSCWLLFMITFWKEAEFLQKKCSMLTSMSKTIENVWGAVDGISKYIDGRVPDISVTLYILSHPHILQQLVFIASLDSNSQYWKRWKKTSCMPVGYLSFMRQKIWSLNRESYLYIDYLHLAIRRT